MTVYENDKGTQWRVLMAWHYHSGYMIYRINKDRKQVAIGLFCHTEKEAQDALDAMAQKKGWKKVMP